MPTIRSKITWGSTGSLVLGDLARGGGGEEEARAVAVTKKQVVRSLSDVAEQASSTLTLHFSPGYDASSASITVPLSLLTCTPSPPPLSPPAPTCSSGHPIHRGIRPKRPTLRNRLQPEVGPECAAMLCSCRTIWQRDAMLLLWLRRLLLLRVTPQGALESVAERDEGVDGSKEQKEARHDNLCDKRITIFN